MFDSFIVDILEPIGDFRYRPARATYNRFLGRAAFEY